MSGSAAPLDALKERLEALALTDPARLETRVAMANLWGFALLGLLVFLGVGIPVLVLLVVATQEDTASVLVQFLVHGGFLLPVMSWYVLKGLQVSFTPPEGIPLLPENEPRLWSMVEELAALLDAPAPQAILLDGSFNASAVQKPGLGAGPGHNTLVLGLPLMEALDEQELRAVIAHELGHFAGQDGRRWARIHRQGRAWSQLDEKLSRGEIKSILLNALVSRFSPWHACHAFVLARLMERKADRHAATASSPALMGTTLGKIAWQGMRLDQEFWPGLDRRALRREPRPDNLQEEIRSFLHKPSTMGRHRELVATLLEAETAPGDTHPCTRDRLEQLGCVPEATFERPPLLDSPSAASTLLEDREAMGKRLSREWHDASGTAWEERTKDGDAMRERLKELPDSPKDDTPVLELVERIGIIEALHGTAEALAAVEAWPEPLEKPGLLLLRGRLRIELERTGGREDIEAAQRLDPGCSITAIAWLLQDAWHDGDADRVKEMRSRRLELHANMENLREAVQELTPMDLFEASPVTEADKRTLGEKLTGLERLGAAWILRKTVPGGKELPPVHVIFLRLEETVVGRLSPEKRQEILAQADTRIREARVLDGWFFVQGFLVLRKGWELEAIRQVGEEMSRLPLGGCTASGLI
ncbi:MAG: hypothetical protein RL318_1196 [Fibrobacterota bacterium]